MKTVFKVGDQVRKITGEYLISGEVRSVFTKADGAVRVVVEHLVEYGGSFMYICSEDSLALDIDNDGWIDWKGGECPVASETLVDYVIRNGEQDLSGDRASTIIWNHMRMGADIMAYRIHK